ncbi:Tetratricopeptide repeat superfamily protein [Perilla frutescens var. hirtella]|uniref:Tetratricopeptide repeat superfamily protein n=1 Tax=Perilla frutescens var. hirtella TaxID=608512 RepID=A0AAD4JR82_PERFH|nr:Tetratricopeptide repeat superfamily protein [Perilla frutescens var. hirtella]
MAFKTTLTRSFSLSKSQSKISDLFNRLLFSHSSSPSPPFRCPAAANIPKRVHPFFCAAKPLCTSPETKKRNAKLVNFSPSSDSDSESDTAPPPVKRKLPPPYNPFSKKPAIEEPDDPKNLQEVFAKIREDGLTNSAAKMFDGLSQDGLTHEALELFSRIKDRGEMPDVVAHTAVMEAYVEAGQAKEAHKVYRRMLACGVAPNAYTYRVVIRGLAESGDAEAAKAAKRYVGEMVGRGMRPNAGTCVAAFEGLVAAGMEVEGREMLEMLKAKGVVPDEGKVRDVIKSKRGSVARSLINVLYGKS